MGENDGLGMTNYGMTNYGVGAKNLDAITNDELRITNYELGITNYEL